MATQLLPFFLPHQLIYTEHSRAQINSNAFTMNPLYTVFTTVAPVQAAGQDEPKVDQERNPQPGTGGSNCVVA